MIRIYQKEELEHENAKKFITDLVNKRSTKLLGMITSISPGILHNEIDTSSECNGVMWYQPLYPTPKNVDWGA